MDTSVFYMEVNSIRADNSLPLVPKILNKTEANTFGQFLCVRSSMQFNIFNSWVFYDIPFSPRSVFKGKKE